MLPIPAISAIAIVDDDPVCKNLLRFLLKKNNFNIVFEAENGIECIRLMQEAIILPHLIILDIEMPLMDGFETAKRLKLHWPEVKIIAHSSIIDPTAQNKMIACGADHFIIKDLRSMEVVDIIRHLLQ